MSNRVSIDVNANVNGVEEGLNKIDKAATGAAESLDNVAGSAARVGKNLRSGDLSPDNITDTKSAVTGLNRELDKTSSSAHKAGAGIKKTAADVAKELERASKILSKEFNKPVSNAEAERFLEQFKRMQSNRHLSGGSKIRQFDTFEEWHRNNSAMFVNQRDAERYKRRVLTLAGQGAFGSVPSLPVGGKAPEESEHNNLLGAVPGKAMGLMRGALGLAGVMGAMAMAGRAVDLAKDEATASDQLLRSTGDLNQSFERLREQARQAGEGLGVAYTEAVQLSRHYATITNATGKDDLYGNMRTGFGLSRGYGLELAQGVTFMAQMRHAGSIGSDDQNGRKFALMIAESIEKGGNTAKAGEVLKAVSDFTAIATRLTLSPAHVTDYAGALAGLTATHTPGLDVNNSAAMLQTADQAMRQGGAYGEASLNLTYGALSQANGGNLNPMIAKMIMGKGMFGSGADLMEGPLGKFLKESGFDASKLSGTSNFELVRGKIFQQMGHTPGALEAMKNYFGLQSYEQAAALSTMKAQDVTGMQKRLKSMRGVDLQTVSASGLQNLAEIESASPEKLQELRKRISGRSDLTATDRERIEKAFATGNTEDQKNVLAAIMSTKEQEKNIGTETRDAVVNMDNELTKIGYYLLPALNTIRDAVTYMASNVNPDSDEAKEFKMMGKVAKLRAAQEEKASLLAEQERLKKEHDAIKPGNGSFLDNMRAGKEYADNKAAQDANTAKLQAWEREWSPVEQYSSKTQQSSGVASPDEVKQAISQNTKEAVPASAKGVVITTEQENIINAASNGDEKGSRFMRGVLGAENKGFGYINNSAVSEAGAVGAYQFMPDTWKGLLGKNADLMGMNPRNFSDSSRVAYKLYQELKQQYNGNEPAMVAAYHGGNRAAQFVLNDDYEGLKREMPRTYKYVSSYFGATAPEVPKSVPDAAKVTQVAGSFAPETTKKVSDTTKPSSETTKSVPDVAKVVTKETKTDTPKTDEKKLNIPESLKPVHEQDKISSTDAGNVPSASSFAGETPSKKVNQATTTTASNQTITVQLEGLLSQQDAYGNRTPAGEFAPSTVKLPVPAGAVA